MASSEKDGGGDAAGKKKPPQDSSESTDSVSNAKKEPPKDAGGIAPQLKNQPPARKRKDGTANKMSFDVDELEEGLYVQVEDEEDVEEVIEYEEIPEKELAGGQQEGEGDQDLGKENAKSTADANAAADDSSGYKIRPDLAQKFRPGAVQVIIERAIKDKLEGRDYSLEECEEWVKLILEDIHEKVKGQNYRRYKIISQVTMGERRGEGAASANRCLWDAEADCMATYTFLNDSIFCSGTVYGIYYY